MSKTTKPAQAQSVGEEVAVAAAPVAKTTATSAKKPDARSAGFSVYIGPSIPGVIQSGHIYDSPRADALKSIANIVEKYPLVASLVVDGATLAVDRTKVKTPGNLLYVNYHKLAAGKIK